MVTFKKKSVQTAVAHKDNTFLVIFCRYGNIFGIVLKMCPHALKPNLELNRVEI